MVNMRVYIKHRDLDFAHRMARSMTLCEGIDVYYGVLNEQELKDGIVISFDRDNRNKYKRFAYLTAIESDEHLEENRASIYFFTSTQLLVNKLRFVFGYADDIDYAQSKVCKLISIVSENGASGVTTLSIGATHILDTRFGIKSVYMSLRTMNHRAIKLLGLDINSEHGEQTFEKKLPFSKSNKSQDRTVNENELYSNSLVNFLYAIRTDDNVNIDNFIEQNHGIFHFHIPIFNNRVSDIDSELIERILRGLSAKGYGCLLLDIGTSLNRQNLKIAEMSDEIIAVNSYFLNRYIVARKDIHNISIDINNYENQQLTAGEGYFIPFCREISLISFDEEYGFELERILEAIVAASN